MKMIGLMMLLVGVAGLAMAGTPPPGVPEIDAVSTVGAVTLLSGALLVIRSRRRRQK